jgi:hypothetical protein
MHGMGGMGHLRANPVTGSVPVAAGHLQPLHCTGGSGAVQLPALVVQGLCSCLHCTGASGAVQLPALCSRVYTLPLLVHVLCAGLASGLTRGLACGLTRLVHAAVQVYLRFNNRVMNASSGDTVVNAIMKTIEMVFQALKVGPCLGPHIHGAQA